MELTGKNVTIHLSTPLLPIDAHGSVGTIKGKILEKLEDGFLIQIQSIEPNRNLPKYTYATIFVPTHKIDFMGVIS
jgi:hypothetical protein